MKNLCTIQQVREHVREVHQAGQRIGLVPTMGALHQGHRSLIKAARANGNAVVVSIFVNPTQFVAGEDFDRYPRPLEADLAACREEDVAAVFVPSVTEMYPPDSLTAVTVSRLEQGLCGPHRPGHFVGVATVVAKLFNIVQPDAAYFGQKDAQQAVIIRRMVRDLNFPIEIVVCPIIREPDGLAMSSRNVYLSPGERAQALSLSAALRWARDQVLNGERATEVLLRGMRRQIESAGPCAIDYIDIVDADELTPKPILAGRCLMALAVRIGKTRLIDNGVVEADSDRV